MSGHDDERDQQWLDAIAGRPNTSADQSLNAEAAAIRRALLKQRRRLEAEIAPPDDGRFERLVFRLRREGLLSGQVASRVPTLSRRSLWAVAATVIVTAGVVISMRHVLTSPSAEDVLATSRATVLVVNDPSSRAAQLVADLRAAGQVAEASDAGGGRIKIRVKASKEAISYLETQRAELAGIDKQLSRALAKHRAGSDQPEGPETGETRVRRQLGLPKDSSKSKGSAAEQMTEGPLVRQSDSPAPAPATGSEGWIEVILEPAKPTK